MAANTKANVIGAFIQAGESSYDFQNPKLMPRLKSSGFNTIIITGINLAKNGSFIFNNSVLVSNGEYTGNHELPFLPQIIEELKANTTSITKVYFVIGGERLDFSILDVLYQLEGDLPGSLLYKSFEALKKNLPALDGFVLDDADYMRQEILAAVGWVIHELGFDLSFSVVNKLKFWTHTLKNVYLNGSVTSLLVKTSSVYCKVKRCPTLEQWQAAIEIEQLNIPVYPVEFPLRNFGFTVASPKDINDVFQRYAQEGATGGFLDYLTVMLPLVDNVTDYSKAISNALYGLPSCKAKKSTAIVN